MKALIAMAVALTCTACESQAEYQQRVAAFDDHKCRSYGFTLGTDAYGQCRVQLDVARSAALSAIAAEPVQRSVSCSTIGGITSCY